MSDFLTTRELEELLKVDRITIYRMLNDGRLRGVKIGNQWRFSRNDVNQLLGEKKAEDKPETSIEDELTDFPVECVQNVQEIFAGIIGIGAVAVTLDGENLTEPTFSNPFCRLMMASPSGREACKASWRKIALHTSGQGPVQTCHAGLCYQRAIVQMDDQPVAWMIAGQFYINPPDREAEQGRLEQLSEKHDISLSSLTEAARKIPVLTRSQQAQVQEWTPKVASTIKTVLCERSDLIARLQRIAEISTVHPTVAK